MEQENSTGSSPSHNQLLAPMEEKQCIRIGLRNAVEQAIITFANGFLAHPRNEALREDLRSGRLSPATFYQQLLYLIYRLLFLMVAEERGLLSGGDGQDLPAREYFTIGRLRSLADESLSASERFSDLYLNLQALFHTLCNEEGAAALGLPPLNGELFESARVSAFGDAYLNNRDLLTAIHTLSWFVPRDQRVPTRVNYRHMDVEELGSVYESLLDLHPIVAEQDGRLAFHFGVGTERKSTGSYYTRPELVQELVKSALVPVIEERLQAAKPDQREAALLGLTVCDPACGSGHFLLAAARRIGTELAKVRTGEEAPPPEDVRRAVRDAITHCIYGVDKNPLAVDLCKVALWIEGHYGGRPLTFLDHHIRCGDSLVGVFDLSVLEEGIPDDAFKPVTGDDKNVAGAVRKRNKQECKSGQATLSFDLREDLTAVLDTRRSLLSIPDNTLEDVRRKREAYEQLQQEGTSLWHQQMACHLWTAAFFAQLTPEAQDQGLIPTTGDMRRFLQDPASVSQRLIAHVWAMAQRNRFFHWPLEFPEVFERGGFDCILSNPPWERIKLQEKEFFATRDPKIAEAPNKAARQRLITSLRGTNPALFREFTDELHTVESTSKFLHQSKRYPLTGRGDVNTYAIFAELYRTALGPRGGAGIIIPTGIATDDTTKAFFKDVLERRSLISLYDFENREGIFPAVHRSYKFCLLCLAAPGAGPQEPQFAFFLHRVDQIADKHRVFKLPPRDLSLINPNTRTCPVFRTAADAALTRAIYQRVPVLVNEAMGQNPWGVSFLAMFHMANDSHLFRTRKELLADGFTLVGNRFVKGDEVWLPLYEAKMIWHFDHRFGSYATRTDDRGYSGLPKTPSNAYRDPSYVPQPWYWVPRAEVEKRLSHWPRGWLLGFRDITRATDERTAIFSLLPRAGVGHNMSLLLLPETVTATHVSCLLACVCSLPFDYVAKQKIAGVHMSFFCVEQLPVLPPSAYSRDDLAFIVPRVVELVYTAWDIKAFADDVWRETDEDLRLALQQQWTTNQAATGGYTGDSAGIPLSPFQHKVNHAAIGASAVDLTENPLPPFRWDENRRAVLKAELDAYYARLYGLTRKQLRYILDPHGVSERELEDILDPWEDPSCSGPHLLPANPALNFPSETFRVLKDKEEKLFGEYRTRRLVLTAWERQHE